MNAAAYADRRRTAVHTLPKPRNAQAAQLARDRGVPLLVSFIGDTPWAAPTVYADSGKRYAWSFIAGLHVVVVVRAGVDSTDALRSIFDHTDLVETGYPVLIDVDTQEAACVHENNPLKLWQMNRGSELWQQYFAPAT